MKKSFRSALLLAVFGGLSTLAYTYEANPREFWILLVLADILRIVRLWPGLLMIWLYCLIRVLTRGRDYYEHYYEILNAKGGGC